MEVGRGPEVSARPPHRYDAHSGSLGRYRGEMRRMDVDEPYEDDVTAAIDERSAELMIEARGYMADVCRDNPECTEREAFEGWAIQKLAGLQLLIEMLNAQIGALGAEMERRTGGAPKRKRPR